MFELLVTVILALGFALLATQNTSGVTVNIWQYTFSNIPLYIVALGSLLFGLLVAWFISLFDGLANLLSLRHKDTQISEKERTVSHLEDRLRALELENAELKGTREVRRPSSDEVIVERPRNVSLRDRLRHTFS